MHIRVRNQHRERQGIHRKKAWPWTRAGTPEAGAGKAHTRRLVRDGGEAAWNGRKAPPKPPPHPSNSKATRGGRGQGPMEHPHLLASPPWDPVDQQ